MTRAVLKIVVSTIFFLISINISISQVTIFNESFPTTDGAWNGTGDTPQDEVTWNVIQGNGDANDIRVSNIGGRRGLRFNDCDQGFVSGGSPYDVAHIVIDLSSYIGCQLSYFWRSDDVDGGEGMRIEYSTNSTNGVNGTWTTIGSHINPTDDTWFFSGLLNIPDASALSTFRLRITSRSSTTGENMYIDDIIITGVSPFNGTFVTPSLSLSDSVISLVSDYTFTQTVPTDATYDFGIASGVTVTITVPNGDLSTVSSATIGGSGATITSQTATTIQLTMPAGQAEGATFDIVLIGVTNFGTPGTYSTSTVSVPNIATGTNSYTTYSYTLYIPQSPPIAFVITNNQPADKVYGQPDFITNTANSTQTGSDNAYHTAVDNATGKVFISDLQNKRVLRYTDIDALNNGEAAEAVLGQTNFTNNGGATAQNRLNINTGIFLGPTGSLWVTDYNNNRVLRFDNASVKLTGANADGVLGQTNYTNNGSAVTASRMRRPIAVFEESDGTLWVADQGNDRVLRFDNAAGKANGANADGVLGATTFTDGTGGTSQSLINAPTGVSVNNNGRLYISDQSNDRIVWWDNAKGKANGANADGQMGQPNYTTNTGGLSRTEFSNPRMVSVTPDNKFLAVADDDNNRIMIFLNPGNFTGEINADFVFGQPDFTSNAINNGGLSASSINNPRGVFLYQNSFYENYLFVSDRSNHRTKLYVLFDILYTTDVFTPVSDTLQATEVDGDVLTFSIVDSVGLTGTMNIDVTTTGEYTYTPTYRPTDYADTVIYQVCDKDGCDTSLIIFNVLTIRRLWVKADSGVVGSPSVTAWENQSISNDSLYGASGEEPTYVINSINFNPTLLFNGTSSQITKPEGTINIINNMHTSIFVVSKPNSIKDQYLVKEDLLGATTYGNIDVWGDGNSYFEAGTTIEQSVAWGGTLNTPYLWSFTQSATSEDISRNGLEIATKGGGTTRGDKKTLYIGSNNASDYYDGNIAEVMQFQHSLGTTFLPNEINIIESYLAIKYGLTLDQTNDNDNDATLGTDYTLSDGNSAWEDAVSTIYIHDIAGVGRDDKYGLDQRQSKSVNPDAIITIGLGTIAAHNLIHPIPFSNDTVALMWANNDSATSAWVTSEIQYGYNVIYRIKREWLVEENFGDVGELKIQIDSADLPVPPMGPNKPLYIVVDEDKDGDFSTGDLRLAKLSKVGGVWEGDINLADGEYFTFMYIHFDVMRHGKFFFNRKEQSYQWYDNL